MTDEDLMIAYASGSEAALGELFRRYAPILLRLAKRHVGAQADAQDVVQQTFLQLHRARRDFRPDRCFRPWVMTIALNLTRDLLRRRGRARETAVEEQKLPPLEAGQPFPSADSDVCHRVRAALSGLPRDQREVIELHWFENLTFQEIAKILGLSWGAARVRAHRGYVVLRRALDAGPAAPASTRR